jgi:hypothetical protein
MDVLRTVAHELTHRHQHERDGEDMDHTAGETGSPWENEANARAGILMRDYGQLHPELFDAGEAGDFSIDEGVKSNAAAAAIVAALSGTPAPAQAQVQDIIGAVRDIGSLVIAAQKITRAGLNAEAQDEINTYLAAMRGQPDAQGISGLYKLQRQLQNQISEPLPGYTQQAEPTNESASGYIPTKKQAKDPRFSMALTQDIRPGQLGKEANKLNLKTDKQGHPQIAKASGLVEQLMLEYQLSKEGIQTPINKNKDSEQYYKFIIAKHKLGRLLTRQEQEFVRAHQMFKQQVAESDEQLDEVRMSPSNLMQWANSPEAQGIRAGFEAELIFRDTTGDEDDQDMEPDYDMDERAASIQQVMDFFENDEYGYGVYGREAERLQEALDEKYYEWQDEKMYDAFRDEAEDLIKKIIVEDDWNWDDEVRKQLAMMELSDDEIEEAMKDGKNVGTFDSSKEQEAFAEENPGYQRYLEAYEQAEGLLDDLVEDSLSSQDKNYDAALDEFRDGFYVDDDSSFFGDVGLRYMSDIAENYNLTWPYITGAGGNNGSRDWESIGDSLTSAIDMPVKVSSGYHQAKRKEGLWIVEPDSSLQPDDSDDMGLEIVSPPMPLLTALEKLQQVTDWANNPGEGNAYTNRSTGLHMGVSVPYKGGDVDYLKLILFLGDEYVLKSFGRESNTYTKSAMSKFRENIKGGRADPMGVIKLMQSGLLELAYREIQKGVGDGKYTSAHIQDGYIEFRSAGGDWLAEESADPEKLQSTMLRYARAMQIAANPGVERREYAKKLYKLVSPEGDTQLALFSQYAAGELTAEELKQRWAEKAIGTEKKMNQRFRLYQNVDGRWEPVPGAEWNGYPESEVKMKVWAKYGREALDSGEYQLVNMGEQDWEVYDVKTGKTLEIVKGKSKGEVADAVYDKYVDQGIGFQVRPYEDPATMTPRAKLATRIKDAPPEEIKNWKIYDTKTGEVHYKQEGRKSNLVQAMRNFERGEKLPPGRLAIKEIPLDPNKQKQQDLAPDVAQNFAEPASQDATEVRRNWEFVDRITGRVIQTMTNASYNQANVIQDNLEQQNPAADIYLRSVEQ